MKPTLMTGISISLVEKNHLDHFTFLPNKMGFDVKEIDGVTIINCSLKTSMFNIAYGSPKSLDMSGSVREIKRIFTGQPFAWWIPPSDYNPKVTEVIINEGLAPETTEHAMICDIGISIASAKKTDLSIKHVRNEYLLEDFLKVLEVYDPYVRKFYKKMQGELFNSDEKLVVGYVDNRPVSIGILFSSQDNAGIFSLITNEDARGKGYGREMMIFLMNLAKENGCQTVTLSASSEDGYRIYERLGFRKVGEFECFEYKGDW